jgi:sugar phosphate isomerase/epimerase
MTTQAALSRLSLNQRTTASWSLPEAIKGCVDAGLGAIGIWREQLAEVGLDDACRLVADSGLRVSSLCRGGFFTNPAEAATSEAQNGEAIEEAAALNAATLVLVPGGLPPGDRDLQGARDRAARAIEGLVPHANELGVTLGIEPMNPIYAADRGVISTLGQALDIAESFEPNDVGVIDGHIDFPAFTRSVARAGYRGDIEVEIFNADLWAAAPAEVVHTMAERYRELVRPYLDD